MEKALYKLNTLLLLLLLLLFVERIGVRSVLSIHRSCWDERRQRYFSVSQAAFITILPISSVDYSCGVQIELVNVKESRNIIKYMSQWITDTNSYVRECKAASFQLFFSLEYTFYKIIGIISK